MEMESEMAKQSKAVVLKAKLIKATTEKVILLHA